MTQHPLSHHRSSPLLTVSTLLVAVGCILLTACTETSARKDDGLPVAPRQVSLTGTSVCLPHRDTSGPQTMECAFGLKTDDGSFYALDLSLSSQDILSVTPMDERMAFSGTLVPLDDIDERLWDTYDIVGQLRVTSVRHEG